MLRIALCIGLLASLALPVAAQEADGETPCEAKVRLRGTIWDSRAHQLEPTLGPVLDEIARVYQERCVGYLLVIESHAYGLATPELNEMMAELRAAVVRHELVKRGVPESEMSLAPIGDRRPMFPGSGPDWADSNRRITFRVAN
jgi:outer membrane protein OmpA-like peptidoglycan-associated protein